MFIYISRQERQYPYQLAYHRVKTVPCTTTKTITAVRKSTRIPTYCLHAT